MEYVIVAIFASVVLYISFLIIRSMLKKQNVNEIIRNRVILKIEVPRRNEKTPLAAEQMFAAMHGILRDATVSENHFSFEIASGIYGIFFVAVLDQSYQKFFEGQIYAQYPDANITVINDYSLINPNQPNLAVSYTELGLEKEFYLPIRTFMNFQVDPLASITSALSGLKENDQVWIQILMRPVSNFWQKVGKEFVTNRKNAKSSSVENGVVKTQAIPLESGEQDELAQIETKSKKLGFLVKIRVVSISTDQYSADAHLNDVISSFKQFQTGHLNSFVQEVEKKSFMTKLFGSKELEFNLTPLQKYIARFMAPRVTDILNTEELASVFHLPNISVETPNIAWASARRLQFPLNLPSNPQTAQIRFFGQTDYHNTTTAFGIKREDRRRHMYILGKTGTGKSSLMKNMIIADIVNGEGVCYIDPHGQDIEDILQYIPPSRINDVIYIDPSDLGFPVGLNLLELKSDEQRDLVADGVVEVFKKHFDSWGPRLQYILHNTILTLLFAQNATLLGVQRILRDKNYRKFIMKQLRDPILYKFWSEEYDDMERNSKLLTEAVAPIQNKIGRFLSSAMIRNIVGQIKSSIDLEYIMNNKQILLVNLSQGKIGEENSALLGGMLITRIQSTAMQRVNIPEAERTDFYLYVDEFQNFATSSFAKILSEARKYKLNLIIAHQYIAQLTEDVRDAVFGNVGSIASFVVGPQDALTMQKEFAPFVIQDDLVSLERYHMVIKLMIDGEQSKPFTAVSLPMQHRGYFMKDQIIEASRANYSKPREVVEDKIKRWSEGVYNSKGNLIPKNALPGSGENENDNNSDNKPNTYKRERERYRPPERSDV
jgi:hypothetical protein